MTGSRQVKILPYNSQWPELFKLESHLIQQTLGHNFITIHHIGSTSVSGLAAKPIIDMIPVVRDITQVDRVNETMQSLRYIVKGEYGIPFRRFFHKTGENGSFNVHVFEVGSPEIDRHLRFRDWMRTHLDDRNAYGHLKVELAVQYPNDIMNYCLGKEPFITDIDRKAGFCGLRMVMPLTTREWEAVQHFRQTYFFDKIPMADPYTWTFDHPDHVHFVLYQGTEIIGYAHLQQWPDGRTAMRIIVIEDSLRNRGNGGQFLALCEKWLRHQGEKSIHVESSPEAQAFYRKNGYVDMPFNDPEESMSFPQDIPLGKVL